ncbi:outer membrane beta-barrel protein [Methylobacterium durans]|uniref:outer membrane protein n=1 Tax=Methylobacterium durans TaxID=2202825 RepID=UPI002AFF76F6|nr:outer membrane beta-barrel protein [Methylobacterium durans]MEA1830804.1 outer membrane beta-barrel protein [Methylobacterium durans]
MRTVTIPVLVALGLFGLDAANAADLDYGVLRGPEYEPAVALVDWSGLYFGAHAGYTSASHSYSSVFQPTLANYFRRRDIESEFSVSSLLTTGSQRVEGTSFGAFAGYNFQFDETVLGLEVDYTRFGKQSSSFNEIARAFSTSGGMREEVYLAGTSTTKIEDYGTIRGRAGYAIGNFMPFVTGGFAIGRANITDAVTVQNYGYNQGTYQANQQLTSGSPAYVTNHGYRSFNQAYPGIRSTPSGQGVQTIPDDPTALAVVAKTKTVGGITLGAGLEYALTQNLLLRAEYQYVLFNDFDGHKANLNTVRGGAAVKF